MEKRVAFPTILLLAILIKNQSRIRTQYGKIPLKYRKFFALKFTGIPLLALLTLVAKRFDYFNLIKASLVVKLAVATGLFPFAVEVYKHNAIGTNRLPIQYKRLDGHLPIIGALPLVLFNLENINEIMTNFFNRNDCDIAILSVPFQPSSIIINDPESLEHILSTNFNNYVKGPYFYDRMTSMFGHGIFNTDGKTWYMERKLATKIFTTNRFKAMFDSVFPTTMEKMIARIDDFNGAEVDLSKLLHQYFLDSFGAVAFGLDLNSLSGKEIPFATGFDYAQKAVSERFFNPFWKIQELFDPKIDQSTKIVRNFGKQVILDRRANPRECSDLLQLFMDYRDENGNALEDDALVDQVINFIIAGRDTTAQTLSWLFYNLHSHPEVVEKLLNEVDEVVGEEKVTYEHIKKLEYAKAVLKETLRLHPSVSRNSKFALDDDVLPNGAAVRKGDIVSFSTYTMGRAFRNWGPDALEFKPERWINTPAVSNFKFPAFNAGPRICIGKTIAELQGIFVFVTLLRTYDIKLTKPESVMQTVSLTLPMKYGMKCTLTHRSK